MATVKIWTGAAWEDIDSTTPLPVATASILGGVKIGSGVTVAADGTISVSAPPAATVAPSNLAATAAVGTATAYARADHVHKLPTAAEVGALTQTDADARYVNLTGDAMTGTLTTTGRIGVGTAAPAGSVHVAGSGQGIFIEDTGANRAVLGLYAFNNELRIQGTAYVNAAQPLTVWTANAERMRIDANGNVGINTTPHPSARLHVSGGQIWHTASDFVPNSIGAVLGTGHGTAAGKAYAYIAATNAGGTAWGDLVLQSFGGRVGINTPTPQHPLFVNGVTGTVGLEITDHTATKGAHFNADVDGLMAYQGPWGTGKFMGYWKQTLLEHYSNNSPSYAGSHCADTGNAGSAAVTRAYHVGSGSVMMVAYGEHSHYLVSDSPQGNFVIGTSSTKDLTLNTNNVGRIRITKDGALSATVGNGTDYYPAFLPRAWVHFNAAKAILASGNVSSVASNGVGIATITLTTFMPDANFAVHAQANNPDCFASAQVLSSSQVRVWIWRWTGAAWQYSDQPCMVSIIR
jgi:hypothetical protein